MRIVIIGAGSVGFYVAKELSQDDHDITIVEIDPEKCKKINEHLDVMVVEGNGASPNNLQKANVQFADYVLALTRVDEVNLIASQQAHELGAKRIIARLRNQQYSTRDSIIRPEKFGVDVIIHPEKVACEEICQLVKHPYATQIQEFEGGRLVMLGVMIPSQSPLVGKSVKDICKHEEEFKFGVVTVYRNGETFVPWGDFVFHENDLGYFIIKKEKLSHLLSIAEIPETHASRIMIIGGSKIGRSIAESLKNEVSVRLIESNRQKAGTIANNLHNTMVIHADGTDIEFLKSENIHEIDSFIAVSADEQTNLLSGMLAHHLGVKQVIIHLTTTEYLPIVKELGFASVISKNVATANAITAEIHSDKSQTALKSFDEMNVEIMEMNPEPGSMVTKKPLSELDFPKASIIGVINHHGHLSIARGTSVLTDEDTVLIFTKKQIIPKLKKLFKS